MSVNTNLVSDTILVELEKLGERVFRNKAKKKREFPYITYRVDRGIDTYPSSDKYLNIYVFDDEDNSVRAMEDLADSIENTLNHQVINTDKINIHLELEDRQNKYGEGEIKANMINLRFVLRIYFK